VVLFVGIVWYYCGIVVGSVIGIPGHYLAIDGGITFPLEGNLWWYCYCDGVRKGNLFRYDWWCW
jgi:hypothetical protein